MHLHVKIQLEGKASRARVTEIIILLKCLSHGKLKGSILFPLFGIEIFCNEAKNRVD